MSIRMGNIRCRLHWRGKRWEIKPLTRWKKYEVAVGGYKKTSRPGTSSDRVKTGTAIQYGGGCAVDVATGKLALTDEYYIGDPTWAVGTARDQLDVVYYGGLNTEAIYPDGDYWMPGTVYTAQYDATLRYRGADTGAYVYGRPGAYPDDGAQGGYWYVKEDA